MGLLPAGVRSGSGGSGVGDSGSGDNCCCPHNIGIVVGEGGAGGSGIGDAPADGHTHGRKNGAWTRISNVAPLMFYRGAKANPETLRAEHPADVPGAYAVVLSTHTVWIWDKEWMDTGESVTNAGIMDAPSDNKTYGRKNAEWVETGAGGIGDPKDIQHNSVSGIQGGRVEDGRVVEAYHLSREEYEKLPHRPTILSPVNGAENINQVPQILGSAYLHPWDVPMWGKHIQIATDVGFATVVYELEGYSGSPVFQVPLKADNTPYLTQDTEYFARIRYQDVKGRWSHWSAGVRFKTMTVFPAGLLLTPVMLMPSDGGVLPRSNPVMAMSSPKVAAGTANFDKADWQIASDSTFATTLYNAADTPDLTAHLTQGVNLATSIGAEFFARGRQKTATGEVTPWAIPARFTLAPEYDHPVFGLRRVFSKRQGRAFVYNIDLDGRIVFIPKRYWDKHPLYAFLKQNIVLGKDANNNDVVSEMAFVPPIWEKCNVYDNADGDMVIDLWFSATPQSGDGWFLDPAFAKSPSGFLFGRCTCSNARIGNTEIVVSSSSKLGTGYTLDSEIRNLQGIDPLWHRESVYERRLLLDLMTAEILCTAWVSEIYSIGELNSGAEAIPYRGFFSLIRKWGAILSGWGGIINGNACIALPMEVKSNYAQIEVSSFLQLPVENVSNTEIRFVSEIYRGMKNVFGFDIAILGIPKKCGLVNAPYGLKTKSINIIANASHQCQDYNPPQENFKSFAGYFGLNSHERLGRNVLNHISKWLS